MLYAAPEGFQDDTTILCSKENETLRILVRLDALINWGSNSFKPKKFRSLSIRKGGLDEDVCFKVTSQDITRIRYTWRHKGVLQHLAMEIYDAKSLPVQPKAK
ncbi:reverse transcriptase [Plakobranchus ocellatus]|uniref:Reverse transcriptase n=1 Tax=Plakobranchus ocellatus TaxID=259542 RepID=A0AAV4C155_9GAST|nr:reverse transcriptase [Plakobranchus ocellatus]